MPPGYVSLAHTPEREREQAEAEQRYANCDQIATQFVLILSSPIENAAPVMAAFCFTDCRQDMRTPALQHCHTTRELCCLAPA